MLPLFEQYRLLQKVSNYSLTKPALFIEVKFESEEVLLIFNKNDKNTC